MVNIEWVVFPFNIIIVFQRIQEFALLNEVLLPNSGMTLVYSLLRVLLLNKGCDEAEHLSHGTEPLLRAAVFLVDLIAGASSDKVVVSRGTLGLLPLLVD